MFVTHKLMVAVAIVAGMLLCPAGCRHTESQLANRQDQPGLSGQLPSPEGLAAPVDPGGRQEPDAGMTLARSLERQGRIDQAIGIYQDIVKQDDSRADAYHRLAVLHDLKGECDKSWEFYHAALQRAPQNAEVLCDLGYSCYLHGRWNEAEENLMQAIALQPYLARAHNNLGLLLARKGFYDAALTEFARAGCTEADARANLALAMRLEQRWDAAGEQYELALNADPRSKAAHDGLNALRTCRFDAQACGWTPEANSGHNEIVPATVLMQ